MSKKGVFIAAAVAATLLLAGCGHEEPMPQGPMAGQAGPSSKLGKMGTRGHRHGHKNHSHSTSSHY